VVKEGSALVYVAVGRGNTRGVVRLVLQQQGGVGEEEEEGEKELRMLEEGVRALGGVVLAVLQQCDTLDTALQGLSDAAVAVAALQARADEASSEAARHVARSSRAVALLEAVENVHVRGRAGGLSALFESVEHAISSVVDGATNAAMLLLVEEEEEEGHGEGQGGAKAREMWTLWPAKGGRQGQQQVESRQRARLRIREAECAAELRAVSNGRALVLSSSSTQGQALVRQSWTVQHAAASAVRGHGHGHGHTHGDSDVGRGGLSVLLVPVPGAGGRGVAGVLSVVKAREGEEEEEEEEEVEALEVLAAQVGTLLALVHADLALAKLTSEQGALSAAAAGQRVENERLRRLLVLGRCLMDMVGREGHGALAGCRAVEEGVRQYVMHAMAGGQEQHAACVSVRYVF
jgi:hypothetical protein